MWLLTTSIRVTHVVDESNRELALLTGLTSSLEAEDLRRGGAVPARDEVVVLDAGLQVRELNIVEELAALRNSDQRARRGTIIGPGRARGLVEQVKDRSAIEDLRRVPNAEGRLEVDVHSIRDVREGDDVDVVGGSLAEGSHCRRLDEARETFAIAVDSLIDPVTNWDGGPSVGVSRVDDGRGVSGEPCTESTDEESGSGLHLFHFEASVGRSAWRRVRLRTSTRPLGVSLTQEVLLLCS